MKDAADESQIEEISTDGNFALFMAQVCLVFFFEIQDHLVKKNLDGLESHFFFMKFISVQFAPVHHPFLLEMGNVFNNKSMENEISLCY